MPFPNPSTQFKPGQSGNPKGRPKGSTLTARILALLEEKKLKGKEVEGGKKVADLLAETIIERAVDGDYRFAELVMNRVEGKVPNKVAIGSDDTTELVRDYLLGKTDATGPTS
jgi:hypothetical protein